MQINLEMFRRKLDLTLEAMAERVGVSTSMIQRWEKGRSNIPSNRLPEIAKAYECRIPDIFDDRINMAPEKVVMLPPPLPNEAALTVVLEVILDGMAGTKLPASALRPAAAALRLCLELLRDNPAIHANDDAIKAVAHAVVARPRDPRLEP